MSAPPTIWSRLFGSRRPCSSVQEGSGFAVASQAKDPQSPYRAGASVHLKGGTANGTGFLFEIHGTEGALAIVPADPRQATYIQVSEFTVRGAQAGKPLADLSIPESYRWVPPAVPVGLPFNVAQLYLRMAERIRAGKSVSPDFDVAVKRHQLLDLIQKASDTGIRQIL